MRILVVGAAILRDGTLLAARRTAPAAAAGRWELPGGKVEKGEEPGAALAREIREELRCEVTVEDWLDGDVHIDERHALRVAVCRLEDGEPDPVEHDLLRWLSPGELHEVDWLEPDRPFLAPLSRLLRERMQP